MSSAFAGFFINIANGTTDFKDAVGNWFGGVGTWFTDLWTNLKNAFDTSDTNTGNWFTNLIDSIKLFFAGIPEFFADFWKNIANFFINIFVPEEDYFDNIMTDIKESFKNKIPYETFKELFEDVQDVESSTRGLNVNFSGYKIGNKNISTGNNWVRFDFVLKHKDTWFAWCRGFTYIFFIIYNINQFLKFLGRLGVIEGSNISVNNSSNNGKGENSK